MITLKTEKGDVHICMSGTGASIITDMIIAVNSMYKSLVNSELPSADIYAELFKEVLSKNVDAICSTGKIHLEIKDVSIDNVTKGMKI